MEAALLQTATESDGLQAHTRVLVIRAPKPATVGYDFKLKRTDVAVHGFALRVAENDSK